MSNVSNLEEMYRYLDFYLKSFSKFKLFLTLFICLSSHSMFFLKQNAFHTLNRIKINHITNFSDSHSNRENYCHNKGILAKLCPLHPWKKGYKGKCWYSCLTKERKKKKRLNLSSKLSSSLLLATLVVIDFDKNPFKLRTIMFSCPIILWNSGVFPFGMIREVLVKISCCVKLFPSEHQYLYLVGSSDTLVSALSSPKLKHSWQTFCSQF